MPMLAMKSAGPKTRASSRADAAAMASTPARPRASSIWASMPIRPRSSPVACSIWDSSRSSQVTWAGSAGLGQDDHVEVRAGPSTTSITSR